MLANSICGQDCTQSDLHGSSGFCDQNHACQCPEGYSGFDDWTVSNNCHVDEALSFRFHYIQLILAAVGTIVSILFLGMSVKRWRIIPKSKKLSIMRTIPGNMYSEELEKQKNDYKQLAKVQQESLIVLILCLSFDFFSCPYHHHFLSEKDGRKKTMADGFPWVNLSIAIASASIMAYAYYLLLAWFSSLPETDFGALFGIPDFMTNHPNFIRKGIRTIAVATFVEAILIIVLLPALHADPNLVSIIFILYMLINSLLIGSGAYIFIGAVIRAFKKSLQTLESGLCYLKSEEMIDDVKKKQQSLRKILLSSKIIRIVVAATLIATIVNLVKWLVFRGEHQYYFFSIIGIGTLTTSIMTPPLMFFLTNGGLAPLPKLP